MKCQRQRSQTVTLMVSHRLHSTAHHAHDRTDGFRESPHPLTSSTFIRDTPRPCAATKTQLTRAAKCLQYPKNQLHTTTLGCGANTDRRILRGCIGQLTDLQPKKFLHWVANLLNSGTRSEEERRFKVQLRWPSCSCAVYTLYLLLYAITIYSFVETNYC